MFILGPPKLAPKSVWYGAEEPFLESAGQGSVCTKGGLFTHPL